MAASVQLLGVKEAQAAFKTVAPEVRRQIIDHATWPTAQAISQDAKARVHRRFGFLHRQIGASINRRTGTAVAGITKGSFPVPGVGGSALTSKGALLARPTKYGHLVEFGHGGPHPAPAFPFMLPAAEFQKQPYLSRCRAAGKVAERNLANTGLRFG